MNEDKIKIIEEYENKHNVDVSLILKAIHCFYYLDEANRIVHTCGSYGFGNRCREMCIISNGQEFRFSDYGSKWALTKEELL